MASPSRKRKSWTKSKSTNKGRLLPKGDRDHRRTLTKSGREEHTRLFHHTGESGKVNKSRLWRVNRIYWRYANSQPGDVVTIVSDGKAVKEQAK